MKVTVKLPKDLKNLFLLIFLLEFKWTSCSYFVKMLLIEAFITAQNFDIIYLPETFIDSSIDISDTRMNLNGYSLLWADHPSNTKRGSVYVHFFLFGFYFTNIHDSQYSRGRERLSLYLLSTTSTHFTDTWALAGRLLQRAHLCT